MRVAEAAAETCGERVDEAPQRKRVRRHGATADAAVCEDASAALELRTAGGVVALRPSALRSTVDVPVIRSTSLHLITPLVAAALSVMVMVPVASEAKLTSVMDTFMGVIAFWCLRLCDVNWAVVCAYVMVRCAPPVDLPLPPRCGKPVLAQSAAGDVDALRRAARLGLRGLGAIRDALYDDHVGQLLRAIGARMRRLKSAKKPLLFSQVSSVVSATLASVSATAVALRDACALTVAFFFAMRVSELLALVPTDVSIVVLTASRRALRIVFRRCKNRQSIFQSHEPFVVTCAHPVLMRVWDAFVRAVKLVKGAPVFHRLVGSTRDALSRSWFATVIGAAAPGTSPHSARVGAASEMWAARVSLREIMAVGRWTSTAAVMYIISTLESQVEATDRIGSNGALRFSGGDLRRAGFAVLPDLAHASPDAWEGILSGVQLAED